MARHGVKIKPRNRKPESLETRNILSLLYQTREDIIRKLGGVEVLDEYGALELQLRDVEENIEEAKRIMKQELRKGI